MFTGHAGLALVAKRLSPRTPLPLLVAAAYGPDIVEIVGDIDRRHIMLSHSLVSVVLASVLLAATYAMIARPGAAAAVTVGLTYLSHWPADVVTSVKPTWPGGPELGLHLYDHPVYDFALEAAIVTVCWLAYRPSVHVSGHRRVPAVAILAGLVAAQAGYVVLSLLFLTR
jgi:membrane-bound metal-dependent hydrolase YbcI (DUF457 family)